MLNLTPLLGLLSSRSSGSGRSSGSIGSSRTPDAGMRLLFLCIAGHRYGSHHSAHTLLYGCDKDYNLYMCCPCAIYIAVCTRSLLLVLALRVACFMCWVRASAFLPVRARTRQPPQLGRSCCSLHWSKRINKATQQESLCKTNEGKVMLILVYLGGIVIV